MGGEGQIIQADETYYGDTSRRSKASREKRRNKHGNKARVVAAHLPRIRARPAPYVVAAVC